MSSPPALFLFISILCITHYRGLFPLGSRMALETLDGVSGTGTQTALKNPVAWTIGGKKGLSPDSLGWDSPPPSGCINKPSVEFMYYTLP